MRALLAYAAYRPAYRLSRATISAAQTGVTRGAGCRTVAGYDEDVVTMAVAATRRLGAGVANADNLYLGTTSPPLLDKSCALTVHAASGLHDRAFAVDLVGLRAGFGALKAAAETGGIAAMADLRTGRPGSAEESEGGDGAAAFLFGDPVDGSAVAEVLGMASLPLEVMDVWRTPGASFARVGEDRFVAEVLGKAAHDVVTELGKRTGHTGLIGAAVASALNRRLAVALVSSVGAERGTALQQNHRETNGYCGAADLGLLLAEALATARAGETVLALSATGGADALLLKVLKDGSRAGESPAVATGREVGYHQYLTWRGEVPREPARRPERAHVAPPAAFRDAPWKFALVGGQCRACGKVYLPAERVCRCGAVDEVGPYPLADRIGTVVAFSTDGVSDSPNPPALAALVDFGTDGRLLLELTDALPDEVEVGTELEMTFRRTYAVDEVPNYFWKARPKRSAL